MRQYDLVPFRVMGGLLGIVPSLRDVRVLWDAIVNRLNFTIPREIEARTAILKAMGVDTDLPADLLIDDASAAQFPIAVAPPLREYSGDCVMVTGGWQKPIGALSKKNAHDLIDGSATLLFEHNLLTPDLSQANLCMSDGRLSLARFAPITAIDPVKLSGGLRFAIGAAAKWERWINSGLARIGEKPAKVEDVALRVLAANAGFAIGVGEVIAGANLARESAGLGYCSLYPYVGGVLAKTFSPDSSHHSAPFSWLNWIRRIPL
jgi:hypothetical protein